MTERCNNRCVFCRPQNREKKSTALKKMMRDARKKEITEIVFSGGEPTLRKDIVDLVSVAGRMGFKTISMESNGRMFCYKDFSQSLLRNGLNSVCISIHSAHPEIHDLMTRVRGSHRQAMGGLKVLRSLSPSLSLSTRTFVTNLNKKNLETLAPRLLAMDAKLCELRVFRWDDTPVPDFDKLSPTLAEAGEIVRRFKDKMTSKSSSLRIRGVPLSFLPGSERNSVEFLALRDSRYNQAFLRCRADANGKKKTKVCSFCSMNNCCEGVYAEYLEKRGDSDMIPSA